jgi:hypothetical protein
MRASQNRDAAAPGQCAKAQPIVPRTHVNLAYVSRLDVRVWLEKRATRYKTCAFPMVLHLAIPFHARTYPVFPFRLAPTPQRPAPRPPLPPLRCAQRTHNATTTTPAPRMRALGCAPCRVYNAEVL